MAHPPTVCCVSLARWKAYIERDQGDVLGMALAAFLDSECPNRPAIQQTYLNALVNLETEVRKIIMILQQLDCSPLQISQFNESHVNDRTLFIWWNEPKDITSNKHRLCGEDVEFQGGRKVQQHPVPGCQQIIEYQCTTPKKGTSPWSRSIIKLQGSQLWVVNYRPRRVRSSDSPNKKRSARIPLLSKKRKLSAQPTIRTAATQPQNEFSQNGEEWRIPLSRAASDTQVKNTYFHSDPVAQQIPTPSPNWGGTNFHSPAMPQPWNCSPSPHAMDIDMEPPRTPPQQQLQQEQQFYANNPRTLARTVSEPHRQFPDLEIGYQQNGERPYYLPHIKDPSFPSLRDNERLIMYLVDKAVRGQHSLQDVATEATQLLCYSDMQQFNAVIRLVIAIPVRQKCNFMSKQSRLLLYIAGCISPMTRSNEAIGIFTHLFSVIHFEDQQPRHDAGMWHTDFCFVKQQHYVHGQRRMFYVFVDTGFLEVSENLRLRTPGEDFIGKTDFDIFEETFALRFMEEDFGTLEAHAGGFIVDSPMPLPCVRRCWNCRVSSSKIHLSLLDGSFLFSCATAIQCSSPSSVSPGRRPSYVSGNL